MALTRVQPGATIGGKYRLEGPLARGGMGSVWTAQHVELGVPVAIKFMDLAFASSAQAQARFAREAKAAAGLRHPNIVDVRDYGVDGGLPYLVMELLRGEDLGARLHRVRRLSLPDTAVMLTQIARALRGAHEAGIVHRDLKPGNVFLARIDDEEIVKILDFGIAKDTNASAPAGESTRTGEIMGSPHFMSPEQVRGAKDLDARSDLWGLGVIVFRCVTGRLPFNADVIGAVIGQILADPIPTATSIAPDLPPEIDAFFARVLVRDREARYPNARDMANALCMIAGLTPRAMSVSAAYPAPLAPGAPPYPAPAMYLTPQPSFSTPSTSAPQLTPAPQYGSGPYAHASDPLIPPQAGGGGTQALYTPHSLTPAHPPTPAPGTLTNSGASIPAPTPRSNLAAIVVAGLVVVLAAIAGAVIVLRLSAETPAPPAAAAAPAKPTPKPSAAPSTPPAPTTSPAPIAAPAEPREAPPASAAVPSVSSSVEAPRPSAHAVTMGTSPPNPVEPPAPPAAAAPAHKPTAPAEAATKAPSAQKANLPPVGF